ncbi:MAG: hypothetical protein L0215_08160 [Gemmataceae bacterium]|nr:hypothetical protein [Gemmataceae bacterium]
MIRFGCPRCRVVLEKPLEAAGSKLPCPNCGQRLQVPDAPEQPTLPGVPMPLVAVPPPPPPSDLVTAKLSVYPLAAAGKEPPPPSVASRRRDDNDDDRYDDEDFGYPRPRRMSRSEQVFASRAAATGLTMSLLGMGMLLVMFVLWIVVMEHHRGRDSQPIFVVMALVCIGAFILGLMGVIFSSRGLDQSNYANRGSAVAGLVIGIIDLVLGTIVGLLLICAGTFLWTRF